MKSITVQNFMDFYYRICPPGVFEWSKMANLTVRLLQCQVGQGPNGPLVIFVFGHQGASNCQKIEEKKQKSK